MSSAMSVFDRLFDEAVPAPLGGTHRQDEPPVDGGRSSVSVVCLPDRQTGDVVADVMTEALVHAGPGHYARDGGLRHMAMEPWHSVDLGGSHSTS